MAFTGKVALVTGGGSGLGQISAWRLADTGAEVSILDVDEAGMAKTVGDRSNIHPVACDVTRFEDVKTAIEKTEEKFGPLDRITHAAGVMPDGLVMETDLEKTRKIFDINFWGTMYFLQTGLAKMIKRGSGDFIVFGSMAGYFPTPNLSSYCASKAAVNLMMESAYWENRNSGVRIMLVTPTIVKTPLLQQSPSMKSFKPEQVAKMGADPEKVVDNIEKDMEKGKPISIPHIEAKIAHLMRRYIPTTAWKLVLKQEGL